MQNSLWRMFCLSFTIKRKLRLSYVFFLSVILLGSSSFIYNGYQQQEVISNVTLKSTPIILQLQSIREGISELSASSGLYLLTREKKYQGDYHQATQALHKHISALESHHETHPEMVQSLASIKIQFEKLNKSFLNVMAVGTNENLNKPALQLAAEKIGPLFNQILQITSTMLASEDEEEDVSLERKNILKTIYEIRSEWLSLSRNITVFLTYRNEVFQEDYAVQLAKLKKSLVLLSEWSDELTFEQANGLEELETIFVEYAEALHQLVPMHSGDDWRKDSQLIRNELGPILNEVRQSIGQVIDTEQARAAEQVKHLLDGIEQFSQTSLIIAIISTIVAVFIIISLNILVINRLTSTQIAMHEISSGGGLGHNLTESGNDELSALAVDFNVFVGKIKRVVDLVILSSNNLAGEASTMSEITECALELSSSQERRASETLEVNTKMSEQMVIIVQNAGAAAQSVEEAKLSAENGRSIVLQAIESVQAIAQDVGNSSTLVKELANDANSISTVVEVIQSISEQTNLLALNAAIEAARAGEAGRGFAVVADEVRSLSHKIQQETVTIKEKIEQLQKASNSVVNNMDAMHAGTDKTVKLSTQAGEAFDNIVSDISSVTAMNLENAEATEQQQKDNEKVSLALENLSIMSQTMANSTQDAYNSGIEFKTMSEQLKDIVEQFINKADKVDI